MDFKDKVVIVTGGGRGIGGGIASAFAKQGAKVIIAGRDEKESEKLTKDFGEAVFIKTDVRKEADVENMIKEAVKRFEKIDVVINNAGIYPDEGDIADIKLETFNDIVSTNFTGTFLTTKYTLPHLVKSKGNIINIGSIRAIRPRKDVPIYASAKAAVLTFTRATALVYAERGVRVNCICPGPIDTEGIREVFTDKTELDGFLKSNPMKRIGMPSDIAGLALFLASEEASFITGGIYTVDGGSLLI